MAKVVIQAMHNEFPFKANLLCGTKLENSKVNRIILTYEITVPALECGDSAHHVNEGPMYNHLGCTTASRPI